jgi:hypothetical protein
VSIHWVFYNNTFNAKLISNNNQVYRGYFHPLRAMQGCGLISRVRGTAAFFQLLAFSSWHLAVLRNDTQRLYSLQCIARASRKLQVQISDPVANKSVDLIMAVLVFASSSVSYVNNAQQSHANRLVESNARPRNGQNTP